MSTPTPNKPPVSQQGRTPSQLTGATPPVSTPFSNAAQAAFSPRGPRSSPQHVKKSPAASMLSQIPSGALSFDSPSTAAALGLAGPGDMGTDDLRDVRAVTRDDERLKRLDAIINILNKKKGLVSEAGIERLAQRNGFDCLPEDYTAADGRKMRALIIAGSSTQIEIVLDNNIVQNVTLAFPESSEATSRHMDPASKILLNDLCLAPNQSPLTKTLDAFALNLETLATLDRLSIMPKFDCRAALVGIYTSLERLYQWDLSRLREEGDNKSEDLISLLAMCTRNGFPTMHARGQVGLSLQYWKERRLIPPKTDRTTSYAEEHEKIWSLIVGCSPMDGLQIPPARISDDWISKDIAKDDGLGGDPKAFPLEWQEPDNVALSASEDAKNTGIEIIQPDLTTARVPSVVFSVAFDPPVVLPQSDWMRLYAAANMEPPAPPPRPPTFDQIHFPIASGAYPDPSERRTIMRQRSVTVFDKEGRESTKRHRNSLFIYKQIYSMELSHMSFSHPKQLIQMLPSLRQWAFTSTLLHNSFGSGGQTTDAATADDKRNGGKAPVSTMSEQEKFAAFMQAGGAKPASADDELNLDVTIWVHPTPHFQVIFPFRDGRADIMLQILDNGVVEVVHENIIPVGDDGKPKEEGRVTKATLGKALEHMEDLCKWAEWIRSRLS